MPIYKFRCQSCDHIFEDLVRSVGGQPEGCPDCGSPELTRQFAAFSVGKSTAAVAAAEGLCGTNDQACSSGGCAGGHCAL